MSSRALNATAASILGLLCRGPMSGWEVYAGYERSIGNFWSLSRSQVYREIRTLASAGYIEVGETGARERRTCTVTVLGRAAFKAWISALPSDENIRFPLLLTTFFAEAVPPRTLRANFRTHRERHAARLAAYEELLPEVARHEPFPALSLGFGIIYERGVIEWIDALPWMDEEDAPPRMDEEDAPPRMDEENQPDDRAH